MMATARGNAGAVLDSVWLPYTIPMVRVLSGSVVEVRCEVARETAAAGYDARVRQRHAGHLGGRRPTSELWNDALLTPLGVGPVIRVDTESPVQVDQLAARVRTVVSDMTDDPT